jgi:hypothetical protein
MDYFLILWIASSVVALLPRNDGKSAFMQQINISSHMGIIKKGGLLRFARNDENRHLCENIHHCQKQSNEAIIPLFVIARNT